MNQKNRLTPLREISLVESNPNASKRELNGSSFKFIGFIKYSLYNSSRIYKSPFTKLSNLYI